ncbi:MAG: peptide/nickel transport system permease protein [Candidatus Promineifilaceae bacterium]|jgi:peptide/nickel transport system permease protein
MSTFKAIGRRLLNALVLIIAVMMLNFLLLHLAPGDPAEVIAGEMGGATEEMLASIRAIYGLDKPPMTQFYIYMVRALRGDLGISFFYNTPVSQLILTRLWPTLLLVITALLIAITGGTFLGVMTARRPDGFFSNFVTILSLVGYSLPVFWSGLMIVILFASVIPIFPVAGMRDILLEGTRWDRIVDVAHHLVLPAFTLAIIYLAQYSRLARASMLEVLESDYIRTARSKGLSELSVVGKHALRNAILPVVTIAGLQFGSLLSGAILVETVFNWPGLGTLAFESILRRDFPTVLGILLFSSVIVILANIVTDILYQIIDPRIQIGEQRS